MCVGMYVNRLCVACEMRVNRYVIIAFSRIKTAASHWCRSLMIFQSILTDRFTMVMVFNVIPCPRPLV